MSYYCSVKVKATADTQSVSGKGSSSVHVRADGKDRVRLDAQVSHFHQREGRAVALRMNLSQSLLPVATDLCLNMAVNTSSDRCVQALYFNTFADRCMFLFNKQC